jgi:hypothetical protein
VEKPRPSFDDDVDRSLIENGSLKTAKDRWDLGHSPQKPVRAVRVDVVFTLLRFALATAKRLPCERGGGG